MTEQEIILETAKAFGGFVRLQFGIGPGIRVWDVKNLVWLWGGKVRQDAENPSVVVVTMPVKGSDIVWTSALRWGCTNVRFI
jgi:hypothetical protein